MIPLKSSKQHGRIAHWRGMLSVTNVQAENARFQRFDSASKGVRCETSNVKVDVKRRSSLTHFQQKSCPSCRIIKGDKQKKNPASFEQKREEH